MKKILFFCVFAVLFSFSIFSTEYKIADSQFDIEGTGFKFLGKTKDYSILTKYPLDKNKVFSSSEELEKYLRNYEEKLNSSRAFEYVNISYETNLNNESDIEEVFLKFDIKDSHHLLVLPYGKYNSNTGLEFKFKIKDSNFLGSLNELSSEISLGISEEGIEPGLSFSYDYPFKMGIFDVEWVNDYSIKYLISNDSPEWDLKTGLKLSLPYDTYSFVFEVYQYFFKNLDYIIYEDDMYFKEEAAFSVPLIIKKLPNYTNLYYTPKISFEYNWDFDGINSENDYLSSPTLTFGHSLQNETIYWNNCYRKGYSLSLTNNFIYNIQRQEFIPYLEFEGKGFYNFKNTKIDYFDYYGLCSNLYVFTYLDDLPNTDHNYGNKIGERLRGILDNSYFGNAMPLYTTSSAIVLNFDFPVHIFTTNFKKELLNFNFQISPFFDMALVYNRTTSKVFSFKDGYYCAGFEFLIYPLKWSSYTIRASYGINLNGLAEESNPIKGIWHNKELFIGIGLQY